MASPALLALLVLAAVPARADFVDVGGGLFDDLTGGVGVSWVDFDGDGDLDVYGTSCSGPDGGKLFRNDGAAGFVIVADSLLANQGTCGTGMAWADVDADGDYDVYLNGSGGGHRMLRNDGGTFSDVTSGPLGTSTDGRSVQWIDFDRDGDLDLGVGATNGGDLLRNDGDFTFVDVGNLGSSQGTTWGDFNADGWPDVYVAGPPSLLRNNGDGTFTNVAAGAIATNGGGLGCEFGDFDNDGDLDLAMVRGAAPNVLLLRNDGGTGGYADVNAGQIVLPTQGVQTTWGDADNDGDLDLWIGIDSGGTFRLYRNDGAATFVDISTSLGGASGNTSYGAAWADYDEDGDLDMMAMSFNAVTQPLLRNDDASGNHWLHVALQGNGMNVDGVGARVVVQRGATRQVREVAAGGQGWCSQGSIPVEFGLGPVASVDRVEVYWPSDAISVLPSPAVDRTLTISEGGAGTVPPPPATFAPAAQFTFSLDFAPLVPSAGTLHWRRAETEGAYTVETMEIGLDGVSLEQALSASAASQHGIEYWVDFRLGGARSFSYPVGADSTSPGFLPSNLGNVPMPAAMVPASETYVLFGLPFEPGSTSPATVLEDDLGGYDDTRWRFGRFDPSSGSYDEFPSTTPFSSGAGFWLAMRDPVAVGTPGRSRDTRGGVTVELRPGWNMISQPYLFPVALADVDRSAAPDVEARLVGFTGGGYSNSNELEPWHGYWMRNNGATSQLVGIPGAPSTPAAPAPATRPGDTAAPDGGWRLAVSATQGARFDRDNVLGTADDATGGVDRADLHAPPALPGMLRVSFETVDATGVPHELDRDLRASDGAGETWTLVVEAPSTEPVRLAFDGAADVPGGVLVRLEDTQALVDPRGMPALQLAGGRTHRLRIAAGDASYLDDFRAGRVDAPTELALGAAWPNPFSGDTRVAFALPREARVELAIFDVAGRRVRTLVEGRSPAGRHVTTWAADDDAGRRVAPGVYFARLVADGETRTRKITRLR